MGRWEELAENRRQDIKEVLETVYAALNQGQQKHLLKDEKIREIFDLYGVEYM